MDSVRPSNDKIMRLTKKRGTQLSQDSENEESVAFLPERDDKSSNRPKVDEEFEKGSQSK